MSSAVCSTSAAQSRPFNFDVENVAEVCPQPSAAELFGEARPPQRVVPASSWNASEGALKHPWKDARLAGVTPASRLAARPAPEMASSGISAVDALTGGLPRGCLTEIYGPASSGRTTLLLSALAAATRRGEFCALLDASDTLDPHSAAAVGIVLERLLWVRCGENSQHAERRLEQLLRVADLLLESGGFGMIALDLGDLPPQTACRIPLTTWFRFRRAVEHTPTVLLAIEQQSIAGSCSSLLIKLGPQSYRAARPGSLEKDEGVDDESSAPTHAQLLTELAIHAEMVRSRLERKPACSAEITFASQTAWAG
jgi:recA bacterial DNA recombination protein